MTAEQIAEFRFYAGLNDFLPPAKRQKDLPYRFKGHPGIKDPIEVFGVPHPEVDLILVNGQAVGFDYQLKAGDRVSVYPVFTQLNPDALPKLREEISTHPRFVLDVNLGKLAKFLRMLGFDSLYRNDYRDIDVVTIAASEGRIVLTRDRRLLYAKRINHGYWVRTVKIESQIDEILSRFQLYNMIYPFVRCMLCNGRLTPVDKAEILERLEPKTKRYYQIFHRCTDCGQIYWQGSHIEDMQKRFAVFLRASTSGVAMIRM